ncbi:Ig-like domain repeat protein [Leucobacter soli]|uniref:Bacterial Ig-like domain-containing protein n=1 Tax=Leucobacter soli TaxID=2812850 RepID=A0A916JRV2_9MICO|nr:Ig-like domain-containing protein [Leucobacter soli]CAG7594662.1 hypothetical protein LEUCIP111803_00004 [Leucobacter soli]
MKVKSFAKFGVGLGCAVLIAGTAISPAHADPASGSFGALAGLGSDTTQFVMNGLAADIPGSLLASYDATGASATVVTKADGVAIPRANGSGAGRDLLRVAIGQTGNANVATFTGGTRSVTTDVAAGQIQYARSSSGPGAQVEGGVLTYVPFATDAVSYATSANSWIPSDLTQAQLTDIYKGNLRYVNEAGQLSATAGAGYVQITTWLPQAGSGTRSFWIGKVGLNEGDVTSNVNGNLGANVAKDFSGADVQENSGAPFTSGTPDQQKAALVPYSVAQWVAQANGAEGVADVRSGAKINLIGGTAPTTGSGTSYKLNAAFNSTFTRLVYNIIPSLEAEDEASETYRAFVGTDSEVCEATDTIERYGFAALTAASGANACGDISRTDYAASPSSVSIDVPANAAAGAAVTLGATVTSTGDQGGTVTFYDGAIESGKELTSVEIPAGQTSATVAYTPTAPASLSVIANFVPALSGVAYSETTDAAKSLVVTAQSSTTTVSKISNRTYGSAATVTATVKASAGTATGKVTFKDGSKTLGSATVKSGKASLKLSSKLAAGTHRITATYAGSSAVAGSASKSVSFTVNKASAKVKIAKIKTLKAGKTAKVKVTVSTNSKLNAKGTVTIKDGKKTIKKNVKLNSSGKATVSIKKVKSGTHKVTVSFKSDGNFKSATGKTSFKVKR